MSFGAELPEAASVAAVHESALRVLETTGVLVQDDEAVGCSALAEPAATAAGYGCAPTS